MLSRICRRSFCSAFPQPWLFIGLGNPGDKYKGTRHNVGFDMVDAFAESVGIQMEDVHCKAIFGKGFLNGVPVFLAKPQTYMNLSGESFHDDMDLPCGVLRLHPKGGIGRPPMDPKAFLLQKFNATARERVFFCLLELLFEGMPTETEMDELMSIIYCDLEGNPFTFKSSKYHMVQNTENLIEYSKEKCSSISAKESQKSRCCSDNDTSNCKQFWSLSAGTGIGEDLLVKMDPKAFLLQKFNATARERDNEFYLEAQEEFPAAEQKKFTCKLQFNVY
nr:peptidyl-tRNA hydrolase, mitochondrial [Ipomoea batatas]